MENRNAGILLIAVALLMTFIVYSFNQALTDIVAESCIVNSRIVLKEGHIQNSGFDGRTVGLVFLIRIFSPRA